MGKRFSELVIALALAGATTAAAAQNALSITVTRDGAPAANVPIDLALLNQGKVSAGTTGASGDLAMAFSIANLGKATRMQVVIYDCPNDQQLVVFVETGAAVPEDQNCKRRIAGWLWFGRARAINIDVVRGTIQVQGGQSFLGTRRGKLVAGGGAAVVAVAALSMGGGNSASTSSPTGNTPPTNTFNPNGNYPVTNTLGSDPGGHGPFIAMEASTVLVIDVTGTTIRITSPPGSKWTLITGNYTSSTGQVTGEGRGPAAGFSNVLYRLVGTIATSGSSQGQLTGQLTVGAGGEFPGGQPTVFNVTGRKQ